jgi:alkanesulfonate monooxygenase SsuD/methylene tetrahydromethanopterin reductase-like flavin-dependent oxidoreductase (luciferase family)
VKAGLFMMPSHPPETGIYEGQQTDLAQLQDADALGFEEAWIGEHFTAPWEPNPSPELLIAQALLSTKQIKLAPGAHLLPYHNPIALAHRVAFLDHLAQGRLMLGIGIGGLPGDWNMFNVDGTAGENRVMALEALEIMLRLWTSDPPISYAGKYWTLNPPGDDLPFLKNHLRPFQRPHPPIGIAGLSPRSETLKLAGERGFIPLSISLNNTHTSSHWDSVLEGAERTGRVPDRKEWRLVREVYVAETDEKAKRYARDGMLGRAFREYLLPFYLMSGFGVHFKNEPDMADSDVTVGYLVEKSWLVGSPQTVTDKLGALYQRSGGFGGILVNTFDFSGESESWHDSQQLLMSEVLPNFA